MSNQPKVGTRGHFIPGIPDDDWTMAMRMADLRGTNISAAVREFIRKYAEPTEAELAKMTVEQLNAYANTFDE